LRHDKVVFDRYGIKLTAARHKPKPTTTADNVNSQKMMANDHSQ